MTLLNLEFIKENVSDDPEFITELLSIFLTDFFEDVERLSEAIGKGEFSQIQAQAHKAKSSARSLGVHVCAQRLQRLEDLGKTQGEIDEIRQYQKEIETMLPELKREIEGYISST